MSEPQDGTVVRLRLSGLGLRIGRVIGRGGQGATFEASLVDDGQAYAVKWYRPEIATGQQLESLVDLVRLGSPTSAFLWPLEICLGERIRGFGYLMPLLPPRFVGVEELMAARVRAGFAQVCEAGAQLADAFLALHARGLCYRDISFGNVFLDPGTGDILVGDNDNVGIDGSTSSVVGTPYFVAPEVIRGLANPSIDTDRYSLAVLLFCLVIRHHPLLGSRESGYAILDAEALDELLGSAPLFIFDPVDAANRPDVEYDPNALLFWPLLPAFVRDLFTRAFTSGLRDPAARVTEGESARALRQLGDLIRHCPLCGGDQFFDPDAPAPAVCIYPTCHLHLPPPVRLSCCESTLVLEPGRALLSRHFPGSPDTRRPLGEVVRHPETGRLRLRNDSETAWILGDGSDTRIAVLPPGASAELSVGITLEIAGSRAQVID